MVSSKEFMILWIYLGNVYYAMAQLKDKSFTIHDSSGDFKLGILDHKGTIAYIYPDLQDTTFSFTVNDTKPRDRTQPQYHSTGDITLRIRWANSTDPYTTFSTTDAYEGPARLIQVPDSLIAYDITYLLQPGHGLNITRIYRQVNDDQGGFLVQVNVTNTLSYAIELGAFGMSMVFNNDWSHLDLNTTAEECSFTEPNIAQDGGWIKVTRISGDKRVLLIVPEENSGMNGWRPLLSDPTPRGGTFEGFYEYLFLADAYRTNEWNTVPDERLWTPTKSIILQPGASVVYGLRVRLLPSVRDVDNGLAQMQRPVVKVVPGYVISADMTTVTLYILPGEYNITNVSVSNNTVMDVNTTYTVLSSGWHAYQLYPHNYGRVRITIAGSDAKSTEYRQTVSMFVLPSFHKHVQIFGEFKAKNQWFNDSKDPFGRGQSIMGYDFDHQQIILQADQSFAAGLSDESGAGPGLGLTIKNLYIPNADQVNLIDLYINNTLFSSKGPDTNIPFETRVQSRNYGVVRSMFWYPDMPRYKYTVKRGMNQHYANTTDRAYNYVHPTAIYYSLYRIARNHVNIKTLHLWSWYLMQAYQTYLGMNNLAPYYAQYGLMVGSVFLRVLDALQIEGYTDEFNQMIALEQTRANIWQSLPFPFGSEFPWDSTGQEEIYLTAQYFGLYTLSNSTLRAVLAYTHSVPNWGYHGSARRFWDFSVNGCPKLYQGIERVLHHYGSGLNALPIMHAYDNNPDDIYLLEVGIGSITGPLTNIQLNGASSMGLHGDPSKLIHDYWDADYGMSFYGLSTLHSAYAVNHTTLGQAVCYLCDLTVSNNSILWTIIPRDAYHRRIYVEPLGTAFTLDTGTFDAAIIDWSEKTIQLVLSSVPFSATFTVYRLHVIHHASCSARIGCDIVIVSPPNPPFVRGAFEIPVKPFPEPTTVQLKWGGTTV